MNAWLAQYGAAFAWATVEDDAHSYTQAPPVPWQQPCYLWTTNIADSPITRDVKTLFIPNGCFYSPYLRPLKVGEGWQVLVSSMPSAAVWQLKRPLGGDIAEKLPDTRVAGASPLLAVDRWAKAARAVFGANPGPFFWDLGKQVGAQVASVRGDGQRTSDWLPLLRNLCLWLSEPARAVGFPGGATDLVQFEVKLMGHRRAIDWEQPDMAWSDSDIHRLFTLHSSLWSDADWRALAGAAIPYRFLVGAHSAASGGKDR